MNLVEFMNESGLEVDDFEDVKISERKNTNAITFGESSVIVYSQIDDPDDLFKAEFTVSNDNDAIWFADLVLARKDISEKVKAMLKKSKKSKKTDDDDNDD